MDTVTTVTPRIAIVMENQSDWLLMEAAAKTCERFEVPWEARVLSALRAPEDVVEFAQQVHEMDLGVIIAGATRAAHLPAAIAAWTPLPVIGVPLPSPPLDGLDALLATVQMPNGVPVATVAVGAAENAGLLALQILSLSDPELQHRLVEYKRLMATQARHESLPDPE